jgi:hypothetical protein
MEIAANQAFDFYRELYYEGGVSSVYFWYQDDGFAGVVLLKKCGHLCFFLPRCEADMSSCLLRAEVYRNLG